MSRPLSPPVDRPPAGAGLATLLILTGAISGSAHGSGSSSLKGLKILLTKTTRCGGRPTTPMGSACTRSAGRCVPRRRCRRHRDRSVAGAEWSRHRRHQQRHLLARHQDAARRLCERLLGSPGQGPGVRPLSRHRPVHHEQRERHTIGHGQVRHPRRSRGPGRLGRGGPRGQRQQLGQQPGQLGDRLRHGRSHRGRDRGRDPGRRVQLVGHRPTSPRSRWRTTAPPPSGVRSSSPVCGRHDCCPSTT